MQEEVQVNPQMALTTSMWLDHRPQYLITSVSCTSKKDLHRSNKDSCYQIALVISDCTVKDRAIAGTTSPISCCRVDTLVVLNGKGEPKPKNSDPSDGGSDVDTSARKWLHRYHLDNSDEINLFYGQDGFDRMLLLPNIDIVYLIVPVHCQRTYALKALEARKHLLLNDPVGTSYVEFREQLAAARKVNRFVNFSTMFVHHYRVTTFLDDVLRYEKFGCIESISARLTLNYNDVEKVGVSLPLREGDGCIRRLGRYCVLLSILLLSRAGSRPVSAQVTGCKATSMSYADFSSLYAGGGCGSAGHKEEKDGEEPQHRQQRAPGEPLCADCVVKFTNNRKLTFHVGYSGAPTRQVLEVQAHDRYATMTDFAVPHPDGLATYRIYDKERDPVTGKLEVVRGECLDVPSGPPQDVVMWRFFHDLCHSVAERGWNAGPSPPPKPTFGGMRLEDSKRGSGNPVAAQHRELTNVALQTKIVLQALQESLANGYSEVVLDNKDCCLP